MATIFIIGYMASGKTTFGRALARRLGYNFIDLDFYIRQRFRMTPAEIFARKGEAEFRRMESAMLREAGEFEDTIVACGGGTPCQPGNMEYMNSRGLTVCLTASISRIAERIINAPGKRPITNGIAAEELPAFIERHMAERLPYYSMSRITFESDNLESARQIHETVEQFLSLHSMEIN